MLYILILAVNFFILRSQNVSYNEIQVNSLEILNETLQNIVDKNQIYIINFQINNDNSEIYLFSLPKEKNITFKYI